MVAAVVADSKVEATSSRGDANKTNISRFYRRDGMDVDNLELTLVQCSVVAALASAVLQNIIAIDGRSGHSAV